MVCRAFKLYFDINDSSGSISYARINDNGGIYNLVALLNKDDYLKAGGDESLWFTRDQILYPPITIMNFIIVIISCIFLCFYENYIVMTCACINLILMTFNLLPIKTLDGGAVLFFLLSQYYEAQTCRKILKITSVLFISIIYLWSIYVFIVSGYNFSLIIIAIFLTISMFQNNDY